ncbi:MAG: type I DNA topoisomerase [Aphanothece sp. CMT-3BRIN-NPC111]|jgi:DNA topoisomerase-1|nr:type I DNA topoisomerase [Aphanothece sp. CMT-3BRIN-NPC111]
MSKLFLIESPGKIKKLKSILGADWIIKASFGHIVELAKDGEDGLGFTMDEEGHKIQSRFVPRNDSARKVISELKDLVKKASEIYVATDGDREGETIGWHLCQQLKIKNPRRVTYYEITEAAVKQALANWRQIDQNLVSAGLARACLDKLVGFKGSPLIWALNNGAKSVGRVQSATLHLLCQREREILSFVSETYWSVWVNYITPQGQEFKAYYAGSAKTEQGGAQEAKADTADDAADSHSETIESERVLSSELANQLVAIARASQHTVVQVDTESATRKPPAPFITSSLQQAAGSRLKFNSAQTMKVAQALYEKGFITYMRTDSVALSQEYCDAALHWLRSHDPENVPDKVAKQKNKANAQEAHEAIRPTHVEDTPACLRKQLPEDESRLYELIWNRAIASMCKHARINKTRIVTQSGAAYWQARGQVVTFPGYTLYWNDISGSVELPTVTQAQKLTLLDAGHEQKQTQPPPRYSEPKLVQLMERRGIGRPSTYAPTIHTLREREYIGALKNQLQPTCLGMEVDEFLQKHLPDILNSDFTAQMEQILDDIAEGKQNWEHYLIEWNSSYFAPALAAAKDSLGMVEGVRRRSSSGSRKTEAVEILCPKCNQPLHKIPYSSKKMQADHFLACQTDGCDAKMFWNKHSKIYELPYTQRGEQLPHPEQLTGESCPVCGKPLELYEYPKDGERKKMLRCSDPMARHGDDHKKVAYFFVKAKGVFWSPPLGAEITLLGHEPVRDAATSSNSRINSSSKGKPSTVTPPVKRKLS